MGGGGFCSIVGCGAKKRKNRGLSFHQVPKKGVNVEWRTQLLHKINRCDPGFNPDTATICSRHFAEACFTTQSGTRRTLIPGSLPTENMPVKSIETPQPPQRKLPREREAPLEIQRVCYLTLADVQKEAAALPPPWILIDYDDTSLFVGIVENVTVNILVKVSSDFFTSVMVLEIPAPHLSQNIENCRLTNYLKQLTEKHRCHGVTDAHLQKFSNTPPNNSDKHFLHIKHHFTTAGVETSSCVRSKECALLTENEICPKCLETKQILLTKMERAENREKLPLKSNDPLHTASAKQLKKELKKSRKTARRFKRELDRFKQKVHREAVTVNHELHNSMEAVLHNQNVSELNLKQRIDL